VAERGAGGSEAFQPETSRGPGRRKHRTNVLGKGTGLQFDKKAGAASVVESASGFRLSSVMKDCLEKDGMKDMAFGEIPLLPIGPAFRQELTG
jgi:hypothetical protein